MWERQPIQAVPQESPTHRDELPPPRSRGRPPEIQRSPRIGPRDDSAGNHRSMRRSGWGFPPGPDCWGIPARGTPLPRGVEMNAWNPRPPCLDSFSIDSRLPRMPIEKSRGGERLRIPDRLSRGDSAQIPVPAGDSRPTRLPTKLTLEDPPPRRFSKGASERFCRNRPTCQDEFSYPTESR